MVNNIGIEGMSNVCKWLKEEYDKKGMERFYRK